MRSRLASASLALLAACASQRAPTPAPAPVPAAGADAGAPDPLYAPLTTCEQLAEARCALLRRCHAAFDRLEPDDCRSIETAECERTAAAAGEGVRAGRAALDQSRFDECLARMNGGSCPALLPPTAPGVLQRAFEECRPERLFVGRVAEGEVCRADEECAGGTRCVRFEGTCGGVCTPWAKVGEPCANGCDPASAFCTKEDGTCAALRGEGEDCPELAACGPGLFCAEGVCVPPPILDMPCAAAPDRVPYCSLGLACDVAPFVSAMGTCVVRKDEGEACAYHWSCRPGLVCTGIDWSPFPGATPLPGKCAPPLGEGAECAFTAYALWVGDECARGLSCDKETRRCRRLPRQGERCSLEAQDCVGAAVACRPDVELGGRCGLEPGIGEACRIPLADARFPVELHCREGFCEPREGVCRAASAREGEACASDAECLTARCVVQPDLTRVCGARCR